MKIDSQTQEYVLRVSEHEGTTFLSLLDMSGQHVPWCPPLAMRNGWVLSLTIHSETENKTVAMIKFPPGADRPE